MSKIKSIHDSRYRELIEVLAEERIRLNISQGELGEQIGLHQSDISKIEKFERRLDVLEFAMILDVFRISTNTQLASSITEYLGLDKS